MTPDLVVTQVDGEGVEDWQSDGGRVRLRFAQRLLGQRVITVRLEQALGRLPPQVTPTPLRVAGATRESSLIGAGAIPGIQLKTGTLTGAREIPVGVLPDRREELLALVWCGRRRGFGGVATVVFCLLAILAAMLLPARSRAKAKGQRISSANHLKQIGLAGRAQSQTVAPGPGARPPTVAPQLARSAF